MKMLPAYLILFAALWHLPVLAQQEPVTEEVDAEGQSLQQAVEDSTASLMNVQTSTILPTTGWRVRRIFFALR